MEQPRSIYGRAVSRTRWSRGAQRSTSCHPKGGSTQWSPNRSRRSAATVPPNKRQLARLGQSAPAFLASSRCFSGNSRSIIFLLTKGKLLLLGLTKASTLFSMILSLGVYWQVFGWKWALGRRGLDLRARDGRRRHAA